MSATIDAPRQVTAPPRTGEPGRRRRSSRDRRGVRISAWVAVAIFGGFGLLPAYWLLVTSFTPIQQVFSYPPSFFPRHFTLENYANLTENPALVRYLVNSIVVSVITAALSVLGLATIAGGYLGMLAPRFEFTAPLEYLLPAGLAADPFMQTLVHPASAQVMDIFGYDSARPKAPWEYTNVWGYMTSLLLVWAAVLLLGRWNTPLWVRWGLPVAMVLAVVPVVHSLNRALWAGLALSLLYAGSVALRRGRVLPVAVCALDEAAAKSLLAQNGLPVPAGRSVQTPDEALMAAREIGFPVALKALGIAHKSELNAVRLNLRDEAAVLEAAAELSALGTGLFLERMVEGGVAELIIGITRDPHGSVFDLKPGRDVGGHYYPEGIREECRTVL
jgi:hypothetical protein